jgi:misacylated tRNA(Ala) deacylase
MANQNLTEQPKKLVDPRMHSAEHILTSVLVSMFGCGRPFTTHLEKKKSKADYRFSRPLSTEEEREIESRVNAVVDADVPVVEDWMPRNKAQEVFDLSRLPDSAGEQLRIIHIGEYDACPCSGQHVRTTKEIGAFKLISTSFESEALRVRFKLEGKA